MAMGVGPSRGVKSDINVTPLVDVVLVLLIIFMVVTPMLQRGKDVKLPQSHSVEEEKKAAGDPIVVSVTTDRRVFIESDELNGDKFVQRMREKLAPAPGRKILLKGDTALQFEDVRKVMALVREAGGKGIALGVEEIKK
jgi:biopolymer transport protein TolR